MVNLHCHSTHHLHCSPHSNTEQLWLTQQSKFNMGFSSRCFCNVLQHGQESFLSVKQKCFSVSQQWCATQVDISLQSWNIEQSLKKKKEKRKSFCFCEHYTVDKLLEDWDSESFIHLFVFLTAPTQQKGENKGKKKHSHFKKYTPCSQPTPSIIAIGPHIHSMSLHSRQIIHWSRPSWCSPLSGTGKLPACLATWPLTFDSIAHMHMQCDYTLLTWAPEGWPPHGRGSWQARIGWVLVGDTDPEDSWWLSLSGCWQGRSYKNQSLWKVFFFLHILYAPTVWVDELDEGSFFFFFFKCIFSFHLFFSDRQTFLYTEQQQTTKKLKEIHNWLEGILSVHMSLVIIWS